MQFRLVLLFLFVGQLSAMGQYQVNGNATKDTCNCYTLTQAANTQRGSVWNINKINLNDSFDFNFEVFLGCNNSGADGICFGLQPNGTNIGTNGGGMGMGGVTPSVGVFLDTYTNGGHFDPAADHVSLNSNGDIYHDSGADDLAGPVSVANLEDCLWHTLQVKWIPTTTTMTVVLDGNLMFNYVGNMVDSIFQGDSMVYWGFTGATGALNNLQRFCTTLEPEIYLDDTTLCEGAAILYEDSSATFGGVDSWHWNFGTGDTDTVAHPTYTYNVPGSYQTILTITDQSGCQASDTMNVLVNAEADAGDDTIISICNSGILFRLNELKDTSSGIFTWREITIVPSGQFDTSSSVFDANGLPIGTYIFEFIESAITPCIPDTSLVTINLTASTLNAGRDSVLQVCNNDNPVDLGLFLGGGQDAGGSWFDPIGNLSSQSFDPSIGMSGLHMYLVSDSSCSDTAYVSVMVADTPDIEIIGDDFVCVDEEFTLAAQGNAIQAWLWDDGTTGNNRVSSLPVIGTRRYTLSGTDAYDCTSIVHKDVEALDAPLVDAYSDTTIKEGESAQLGADVSGHVSVEWSPEETIISPDEIYTDASPDGTTLYTIEALNSIGCAALDSMLVEIDSTIDCAIDNVFIPNSFTPNGDGNNDRHWVMGFLGNQYLMRIYDRWGAEIYFSKDPSEGWDGNIGGSPANPGVYVYTLSVGCSDGGGLREYKGNITLLR